MAKKMLKDSYATITDIGFECGFSDSAYFIKTFRRAEGISPGAYRKQMRKNSGKD